MRRVSIASGSQLSADAGAAVADEGGNAVDAAVAAVMVSMCTDPGIIAPGAGGFITVWPDGEDPVVIDAYAEMPGRGLPPERFGEGGREVWLEYGGGMHTIVGHGSVAVPGAIAGFGVAIGHGGYYHGDYRYRPCRWLKRRAHMTGSPYWWRRYRRCMRRSSVGRLYQPKSKSVCCFNKRMICVNATCSSAAKTVVSSMRLRGVFK